MSQSVQVGNIYKHAPLYYVLAVTFCFGFQVNFNYFGAYLIFETASIYSKKEFSYDINDNTFTPEFKKAISKDIQCINDVYLGSALESHSDFTEWE